jgi:hypothetical protein
VWVFGLSVTADMDEAERQYTETDPKTRAKQQQIAAAREAVFNAYMQPEDVVKERPTPGRFADPRAAMQAGFTGR